MLAYPEFGAHERLLHAVLQIERCTGGQAGAARGWFVGLRLVIRDWLLCGCFVVRGLWLVCGWVVVRGLWSVVCGP